MWNPRAVLAALTVAAAFAAAPSAIAGTATYNSTGPLFVPDDTGPAGVTSSITVPPGRTAVKSVDVTNFRIFWAASAQELSTQLVGPSGNSLFLFTQGCASYETVDIWTFSDSGTQTAPNSKFDPKCDLPGGTFKPADPNLKKLSIFSGQPSGTWTLRAVDNGVTFTNQGSIASWAVRIVHAPPTLTASAPPSLNLTGPLAVTAQSNANGTLEMSGDIAPGTAPLAAGVPTPVPFTVSAPVRDLINAQGTARVNINLAFTDVTGGTAASSVSLEVKSNATGTPTGTATGNPTGTAKAKKCKKKKRRAASSAKKKCKKKRRASP